MYNRDITKKGETKNMIAFESGEGKRFRTVNYLYYKSENLNLYAEISLPEECSDDYGYITMYRALTKVCADHGIDISNLEWQYEVGVAELEEDADVDEPVYVEIETGDEYFDGIM